MKTEVLKIEITIGNAAFDGDKGAEAARILRRAADRLENGSWPASANAWGLFDVNGNCVGNAGTVTRRC